MKGQIRVLYSFPHKIGAGRICTTAWQQVENLARAGTRVTLFTGSQQRELDRKVRVVRTLTVGKLRVPRKLVGRYLSCQLHDYIVSWWLARHAAEIDIVHCWPLASLRTLQTARRLRIPTVLERPNAHTEFAYAAVEDEMKRLSLSLPLGHDHRRNEIYLKHEEQEYDATEALLCPSDFVATTFSERGFAGSKLKRHRYGYDPTCFSLHQDTRKRTTKDGLTILYAGVCEPRKGLHYALKAWIDSGAAERGKFLICGTFVPEYAERLNEWLNHPSVHYLGQRDDLPEIMREADVLVLSSVEEGSALVTYEARGSGCVLLVSDASGAVCRSGESGLIHRARDVEQLTRHIRQIDKDRALLDSLRSKSLEDLGSLTWESAGVALADCYREVIEGNRGAVTASCA